MTTLRRAGTILLLTALFWNGIIWLPIFLTLALFNIPFVVALCRRKQTP